ncbi:MAG: AAA family ATPase [Caldimicrobium sp.]
MAEISWEKVLSKESLPFETEHFEIIQTHISYIIITDKLVYKIKKPVNFGFLDFTSLEKRKFFCEREVVLNQRLCRDLYLGVVPIVLKEGRYQLEGKGEVVEYAVKMRRLPEEGMMTKLLKEGKITAAHIDLIIEKLVPFYKEAETGERVNIYGSIETISFNVEENFQQTLSFVGRALTERKYQHIVKYSRAYLEEQRELFERRLKEGYIRDGHGDLYSANICFDDLKEVYIFDCIEFNERFRCGDVASDIAFLAMDLDFHRLRELSNYFTEEFARRSKDEDLQRLLNFYKCYRAYVRGKIGCFTYADERVPWENRERALESARQYFDLAFHYAGGKPKVAVFMGLSGTGKTYLSQKFLEIYPAVYISSDIERKKLLNLSPYEHHYEDFEKGIYSKEMTERTYQRLVERTLEEVSFGRDVVLDATFREERHRRKFNEALKKFDIEPLWIWCTAQDEVVKERMEKRLKEKSASDALYEIYLKQKEKFEAPMQETQLLILNTSEPLSNLLFKIENFLKF